MAQDPARPRMSTPQVASEIRQVTAVLNQVPIPVTSGVSAAVASTDVQATLSTAMATSTSAVSTATGSSPIMSVQANATEPSTSKGKDGIAETAAEVKVLKEQLDNMKKHASNALVETTLATLQLLISKPPALFDPYAALAALEQLVDHARDRNDERAKRYAVVLRQCRPLLNSPAMQMVLIKLIADKDEAEVAKVIEKATRKQARLNGPEQPRSTFRTRWNRPNSSGRGRRQPQKCYNCGELGHFARNCPKRA